MKWTKAVFVLIIIFVLITACSDDKRQTLDEVEEEYIRQEEEKAAQMDEPIDLTQPAEFDGIIVQNESGLSLHTGAGEFIIENGDLRGMEGLKVKVVGSLEETETGRRIHITSITPIE